MKTMDSHENTDFEDFQQKYNEIQQKYQELEAKAEEKDKLLSKLKLVSEAVYDEYTDLRTRYDVETETTAEVMKRASLWYKENKDLKRKSALLLQKASQLGNFVVSDIDILENEENAEQDQENEIVVNFQETIKKMKEENASLRKTLDLKRVQEIDLKESIDFLKKKLEEEKLSHEINLKNLQEVQYNLKQFKRVSMLAVEEFEELHLKYIEEADLVKRLSQENENERSSNSEVIKSASGNDSPDAGQENHEVERDAEKIESELREAWEKKLERLKQCVVDAENRASSAEQQVEDLQRKIRDLENMLRNQSVAVLVPPPPPPPLPPLPTQSFNPIWSLMNLIGGKKKQSLKSVAAQKDENGQQKVMDATIERIKKGEFLLKPVKKELSSSKSLPPAMNEMKNILNSLQRRETESKRDEPQDELTVLLRQRRHKSPSPKSFKNPKKPETTDSELQLVFKKNTLRKRPSTNL